MKIIRGQHPTNTFVSTHPAFYSKNDVTGLRFVNKQFFEEYRYADKDENLAVKIGNNAWFSDNVCIMEGVKIGNGAIIAIGAVGVKVIPPYAIFRGVPAKLIRHRF